MSSEGPLRTTLGIGPIIVDRQLPRPGLTGAHCTGLRRAGQRQERWRLPMAAGGLRRAGHPACSRSGKHPEASFKSLGSSQPSPMGRINNEPSWEKKEAPYDRDSSRE
jgi:hypothetical protein